MNARNRHLINIVSTGVLVTILTLVALFWARWHLHLVRFATLHEGTARVQVKPTNLFPFESVDDTNEAALSSATAKLHASVGLFTGLGGPRYVRSHRPKGPDSHVYQWEHALDGQDFQLYFDSSLGLMVNRGTSDVRDPNGTVRRRYMTQFAGPEGMAETPEESLGRFTSVISDGYFANNPLTVYDKGYRRFFTIRWRDGLVRKGPELAEANAREPVQIGVLERDPLSLEMTMHYEQRSTARQPEREQDYYAQLPQTESWPVLVLDASGRVDLLNPDTLTLTPGVGRLPTPPTLFENSRAVGPNGVAAFAVHPVCIYRREAQKKWAYVGSVAATASRDLSGVQLMAFDPNGKYVSAAAMHPNPDEIYFTLPGASLVTVLQYLVENLHPPAALLSSSLTASKVPASSDYQSLVLLPNSFVAMAARDMNLERMNRFASSLFFMLPAIGLGVFLAWRISRDAERMGLSKQERTLWTLGAFALGLPAYITYRLTRPTVALVTCANCGLGRRADFEKCQRCGAPWAVPELTAPVWRVLGKPEQAEEGLPSRAEETNPSA